MKINFFLLAAAALVFMGCEKEITPEKVAFIPQLVVEGYVDYSEGQVFPTPTYVILTKSVDFFSKIDSTTYAGIFERKADVRVSDGTKEVKLRELCSDELTASELALAQQFLGNILPKQKFCVYLDTTLTMNGVPGKSYTLKIVTQDGKKISSIATVPPLVKLDSLWYRSVPDPASSDLKEVMCRLTDPVAVRNNYHFLTKRGTNPFNSGGLFDDAIINGTQVTFPIQRASERNEETDVRTFGYFFNGDTVQVQWKCFDRAQFDFWQTDRASASGNGPFSTFVRIKSNVEGGLGIWGASSTKSYQLILPK